MRSILASLLVSSVALGDSIGPPLDPTDFSIVNEQPCDASGPLGKTGPLVDRYMCQIGLDGTWFQPYACEMIGSTKKSVYLRHAKWNVPCEIVATVSLRTLAFDGSMMCEPRGTDVFGDGAVVAGSLKSVSGGFRLDRTIRRVKERAIGSGDVIPRRSVREVSKPTLSLNVCRRAWPNGFVSDNERAAALQRRP